MKRILPPPSGIERLTTIMHNKLIDDALVLETDVASTSLFGTKHHRGPLVEYTVVSLCLFLAVFGLWGYWRAQGQRNFGPDEGVYTYVGWSWAQGYLPYQSSWDHKGPLVYLTTMLRVFMMGTAPEAIGVQEIALGAVTAVFLAGIAYYLWGRVGAALALALGILLWSQLPPEHGHMSTPGSLIAMLTTAGIFASIAATRQTRFVWSALWSLGMGLFAGLAITTKLNAVSGLIVGFLVILLLSQNLRVPERVYLMAFAMLGLVLPLAAFSLYFYSAGALGNLVDSYFTFNSIRTGLMLQETGIRSIIGREFRVLNYVGSLPLLLGVLLTTTIIALRAKWPRREGSLLGQKAELIIPLWLLIELVLVASNLVYVHSVFSIFPALALGGTWLVFVSARSVFFQNAHWSLLFIILLLIPPSLQVARLGEPGELIGTRSNTWKRVINDLVQSTGPQDTILTLDNWDGPGILAVIQRRNASKYFYPMPLQARGYASNERWAQVLAELQAKPFPKLVLLNTFGLDYPVHGSPTLKWALESYTLVRVPGIISNTDKFPNRAKFIAFLQTNYRLKYCLDELCLLERSN